MATIDVQPQDETDTRFVFNVEVREDGSNSQHVVTLRRETYRDLVGGTRPPADFVEESFRFLLEREPKESILSSFKISQISRYFPEFENVIRERIKNL